MTFTYMEAVYRLHSRSFNIRQPLVRSVYHTVVAGRQTYEEDQLRGRVWTWDGPASGGEKKTNEDQLATFSQRPITPTCKPRTCLNHIDATVSCFAALWVQSGQYLHSGAKTKGSVFVEVWRVIDRCLYEDGIQGRKKVADAAHHQLHFLISL